MPQRHEDLVAFQRADALCVRVYQLTTGFPPSERFALCAQLRRAAYSVPANIVEGMAQTLPRWRLRHLRIAAGSLAELSYGLSLSSRLGYVSDQDLEALVAEAKRTSAPLHGLIASTKRAAG
jgi:four helix bundle protein